MPAERIVITINAIIAPVKTTNGECFIDRIAAMKNVLSPISDPMIRIKLVRKAGKNPVPDIFGMNMLLEFAPINVHMSTLRINKFHN
jgi:hypothetical protein